MVQATSPAFTCAWVGGHAAFGSVAANVAGRSATRLNFPAEELIPATVSSDPACSLAAVTPANSANGLSSTALYPVESAKPLHVTGIVPPAATPVSGVGAVTVVPDPNSQTGPAAVGEVVVVVVVPPGAVVVVVVVPLPEVVVVVAATVVVVVVAAVVVVVAEITLVES